MLDTEYDRILAYRQGDMQNYYAYCRYNSETKDFETTNCVFFECVDPNNYTYNFKESQYDDGVWADVATYTLTGNDYYSVRGINPEIDENYYSERSFWQLDPAKWRGEFNAESPENAIPVYIKKRYDVSYYLEEITTRANNDNSSSFTKVMFEFGIATDEMCQNNDNTIYFVDSYHNVEHNYTLCIKPYIKMSGFKFIELDESDVLRIGKTLYENDEFSNKTFVVSTYINDVTFNRVFSFFDEAGRTRYFALQFDMSGTDDIPINFIEITDTIATYN